MSDVVEGGARLGGKEDLATREGREDVETRGGGNASGAAGSRVRRWRREHAPTRVARGRHCARDGA